MLEVFAVLGDEVGSELREFAAQLWENIFAD